MINSKTATTILLSGLVMIGLVGKVVGSDRHDAMAATSPYQRQTASSAATLESLGEIHVVKLTVGENGFSPSGVTVRNPDLPGVARLVLEFIQVTDKTCATKVVLPELGITKGLPLKVPVQVELALERARQISFQCGMGMYKGGIRIE